jgi:hypothetical protein
MVLRARYYDPHTAEFTSPDPLEYVDGMSLYRGYFVLVGIDPAGTDSKKQIPCSSFWIKKNVLTIHVERRRKLMQPKTDRLIDLARTREGARKALEEKFGKLNDFLKGSEEECDGCQCCITDIHRTIISRKTGWVVVWLSEEIDVTWKYYLYDMLESNYGICVSKDKHCPEPRITTTFFEGVNEVEYDPIHVWLGDPNSF